MRSGMVRTGTMENRMDARNMRCLASPACETAVRSACAYDKGQGWHMVPCFKLGARGGSPGFGRESTGRHLEQ